MFYAKSKYMMIAASVLSLVTVVSCKSGSMGPYKQMSNYTSEVVETGTPATVIIENPSGNIDIYTHKEDETVYDIACRVQGNGETEKLEDMLAETNYSIDTEDCTTVFKAGTQGTAKSFHTDMTVHIPINTKALHVYLGTGNVTVHDDVKCNIKVEAEMADIKINSMDGRTDIVCRKGNVEIKSGRLHKGSRIQVETGNIKAGTGYDSSGDYHFETGVGNITLYLTGDERVSIENSGFVKVNEAKYLGGSPKVSLSSNIGEISIRRTEPR